ncbi:Gfo/Idh/MocA family protein [Ascidiimonas sp. W6]|uniref:Gfo/Idh/MocA family protein n=1 Tax=Ascidiimonas meishanensis TaxID=3128903 RepID=UPI0030EF0387
MYYTRRGFIKKSSLVMLGTGASMLFPVELLASYRKYVGPNDRIQIGLIGCKGMGFSNLISVLKNSEASVVALCDIDIRVLEKRSDDLAKAGIKKPKWYTDYRLLLEDKDVDAVIIGTPDHWHCLQLTDALSAGKHAYCEKPIANSMQEAAIMLDAVKESDSIVQIGQWQRSEPHFEDAINFVHTGKLGEIRLVKSWAYMGWMNPLPIVADTSIPNGVDYKMWLGPAPDRPFNSNRFHFNFRWFWDYAGGLMTDWGVHLLDYALYGMKAVHPNSVMSMGGKFAYPDDAQEAPDTLQTIYDFGTFSLLWEHAMGIGGGNYGRDHGIAFLGNNGTLILDRRGWEVIPEGDKMEKIELQKGVGNGLDSHTKNFLEAMKSDNASLLNAPIQIGYDAAIISQLGNIAFRTGKRIHWNGEIKRFASGKANKLMKARYHNGWKLPKP